jgi:hypothetical protein
MEQDSALHEIRPPPVLLIQSLPPELRPRSFLPDNSDYTNRTKRLADECEHICSLSVSCWGRVPLKQTPFAGYKRSAQKPPAKRSFLGDRATGIRFLASRGLKNSPVCGPLREFLACGGLLAAKTICCIGTLIAGSRTFDEDKKWADLARFQDDNLLL